VSFISGYSDNYVPKISQPQFPQPLAALHKAEYTKLNYHELLQVCENAPISITQHMCGSIEIETRKQSSNTELGDWLLFA